MNQILTLVNPSSTPPLLSHPTPQLKQLSETEERFTQALDKAVMGDATSANLLGARREEVGAA